MTAAQVLGAGAPDLLAIYNADQVATVAATVGLEVAAAATLLCLESRGGMNVWGHDPVNTGGAYTPGALVTAGAYRAYRARRDELGAQGVGPCQLTDPGLQDAADVAGGCWNPAANLRVGFAHLAALVQAHGDHDGFAAYNGSGPAAQDYAAKAMGLLTTWRARLATTTEEDTMQWNDKAIPDYSVNPPVLLGADVTLGWMANHLGSPAPGQSPSVFAELAKVEAKLDALIRKLGA